MANICIVRIHHKLRNSKNTRGNLVLKSQTHIRVIMLKCEGVVYPLDKNAKINNK